ncbi:MAG: site-specific DNA-methyltransferase [Leptolyngbyaceae cyanobacterium SM1_4_3]|nr:site-specific DNA-methyltransferase [Leptolyngbyaceae cyanobacterium SM1_4_3]
MIVLWGSGTTQSVAMRLGRRFIGADINLGAVQITTKRLISSAMELHNSQPKLMKLDGKEPSLPFIQALKFITSIIIIFFATQLKPKISCCKPLKSTAYKQAISLMGKRWAHD